MSRLHSPDSLNHLLDRYRGNPPRVSRSTNWQLSASSRGVRTVRLAWGTDDE
jgi:hypothetical protein